MSRDLSKVVVCRIVYPVGLTLVIALHFSHKPFMVALVKTIAVEQEPLGLTLSPDFSTVYVANAQSGTISIIDTASQTVVETLSVNPGGRLNSVVVSSEGTTLYATDAKSGNVEVFHLPDGRKLTTIPVRLFPQRMALSKDQAHLYVVNSASNNVSVIDTGTHTLLANIPVNERPYAIVMAPETNLAYVTSSQTHSITIIDTEHQKVLETVVLNTMSRLTNAIMSADGRYLYICDAVSNSIVVVDTTTKTLVRTLNAAKFETSDLEFSPTDLALSRDGKLLYAVGRTGYISVIDIERNTVLVSLKVGQDLRNIALTVDGTAYISSFGTNSVSVVQ
jgi:YVTN family beta-propeller protein